MFFRLKIPTEMLSSESSCALLELEKQNIEGLTPLNIKVIIVLNLARGVGVISS